MKLYTRRGDDGSTDLFGGQRIPKDALRVEAYGCVDELNAFLGLAAAACRFEPISVVLRRLQADLFDLGADLATPDLPEPSASTSKANNIMRIGPQHAQGLELLIDEACSPLLAMRNFILPGGSELAARLHVVRTVCRRAERLCVTLARQEQIGPDVVIYLNRLSDLLFALARRANQLEGVEDVPWKPRG